MDKNEFDYLINQMRQKGLNDDNILKILIRTFEQNKCDIDDLELMFFWMGYELNDRFYEDHNIKRK